MNVFQIRILHKKVNEFILLYNTKPNMTYPEAVPIIYIKIIIGNKSFSIHRKKFKLGVYFYH